MKLTAKQKDLIVRTVGIFIFVTLFLGMVSTFFSMFTPWGDGDFSVADDAVTELPDDTLELPDEGEVTEPDGGETEDSGSSDSSDNTDNSGSDYIGNGYIDPDGWT